MICKYCAILTAGKCFYCANAEDQQMYNYPIEYPENNGLTKREYFAAMAMQGMLANSYSDGVTQPLSSANNIQIAEMAVSQADALIAELNKEPK